MNLDRSLTQKIEQMANLILELKKAGTPLPTVYSYVREDFEYIRRFCEYNEYDVREYRKVYMKKVNGK